MTTALKPATDPTCFIFTIRGQRVMLDADLASLYGVPTKRLNEQVRRNKKRFPEDFMFQLTDKECALMRSQIATASKRNIRYRPCVFTEHGAIMAAHVLKSTRAIDMSVLVVRAFIRLRQMVLTVKELSHKMNELEKKYDSQFKVVFEAIRQLMTPPEHPRRRIGFHTE